MPKEVNNFKLKKKIIISLLKINWRGFYNLPKSTFSKESQPHNPELRNNLQNFHPCMELLTLIFVLCCFCIHNFKMLLFSCDMRKPVIWLWVMRSLRLG